MKIISKCFGIYDSKCWNQQATLWTTTTHTYSDLFSMNNFCFAIFWIFFFRPNTYRSKQRGKITVTRVLFFHLSFWLFAWPRHLAHDIDAARLNRRFENLLVKFSFINYFNNLITGCSSAMFPPLGWKAFLWRWAVFRHLYSWSVFPF